MNVLSAYYDLKVSPTTYDVTTFLALAEMWRLHHNLDAIDLYIVANDLAEGYRENEIDTPKAKKDWMLQNVLLQTHTLVKSCRRTIFVPDRNELTLSPNSTSQVFPEHYNVQAPKAFYLTTEIIHFGLRGFPYPKFDVTLEAAAHIDTWLKHRANGRRLVTITLRQSSRQPERNSNIDSWVKFAHSLDRNLYAPVFVPDTEALFQPLDTRIEPFEIYPFAALSVELRMALYNAAYMNLLINNGPNNLLIFNPNARYIQFRPCRQGINTEAETLAQHGYTKDYNPVLRNSFQKVVLDIDELENIERNFHQIVARIDSGAAPIRDKWPQPEIWLYRFAEHSAYKDALKVLELILETSENPGIFNREFETLLLKKADEQFREGRFGPALQALNILKDRLPTHIEIGIRRIQILLKLDRIEEMNDEFGRLNEVGADLTELLIVWGQGLLATGQLAEAKSKIDTYLLHFPDDLNALYVLAEWYQKSEDLNGYLAILQNLLNLLPENDADKRNEIQTLISSVERF